MTYNDICIHLHSTIRGACKLIIILINNINKTTPICEKMQLCFFKKRLQMCGYITQHTMCTFLVSLMVEVAQLLSLVSSVCLKLGKHIFDLLLRKTQDETLLFSSDSWKNNVFLKYQPFLLIFSKNKKAQSATDKEGKNQGGQEEECVCLTV